MGTSESQEVWAELPSLIKDAETLQDALDAVAEAVRGLIPGMRRASIRKLIPEDDQLEIVAVWSVAYTRMRPGMRMSVVATSLLEVLRRDGPVISRDAAGQTPLLDEILATEGICAWVSIPLHRRRHVVGLLSFSSREPDAFDVAEAALFAGIGASVERRLVELMDQG